MSPAQLVRTVQTVKERTRANLLVVAYVALTIAVTVMAIVSE